MDKNEQRRIWKENRGYAGKSRKWAYRRSKKAIRALREAGLSTVDLAFSDRLLMPEAAKAIPR